MLEKARKKAAIVATSVHETANLSDSDGPVCTNGLRRRAFPKFEPKYEIRARVNIGVDAGLFRCKWRDGAIAISKRIAG